MLKNFIRFFKHHVPVHFQNRYVLVTLIMAPWILFFSNGNLVNILKTESKISDLESKTIETKRKIVEVDKQIVAFKKDKERYARENYFMKKDNEEVFVIEKK